MAFNEAMSSGSDIGDGGICVAGRQGQKQTRLDHIIGLLSDWEILELEEMLALLSIYIWNLLMIGDGSEMIKIG